MISPAVAPSARFGPAGLAAGAVLMAAVGAAYFLLAKLGLQLASINPSATPIWPPTGFAIAAMLLGGYRVAPAILVGAMLANVTTSGTLFTSVAIAGGNTLEAAIAAWLVNAWAGGLRVFDTPAGVARFALIASLAAAPVSATIGVASLTLAGFAEASDFAAIWLTWWLGDLTGAILVTPVVVLWATGWPSLAREQLVEAALVLALAALVGLIAFSPLFEQTPIRDPLGFLAVVPLV